MAEEESPEEQNEYLSSSIRKYEEMKRRKERYFFDVDALLKIIDHFIDSFEFEKALDVTGYALSIHPQSTSFTLKEAQLFGLTGKEKEALALLEKVEHINPFDIEVHLIRGNVYNATEQFPKAISSFKRALELSDDQKDDIYLSLAITYQNMSDFNKAVDYYKLCLIENPNNEVAMGEIVLSLEFSNRLTEGVDFFNKMIDEYPYDFMLWYYLGEIFSKQGAYESALNAYDYCLIIKEDFAPAHLDMAQALSMMERFEDAILRYKTAFEYCQPDGFTYYNIGECYEQLKNFEEARTYYKKAVKIAPEMAQGWYGIGVTFEEEERWYEALHYVKKAIEIDDQNGEYWLALGDCEYRLNNFTEAEECYKKVIDYDPDNTEGWIAYADLLNEFNRPMEASELLSTALLYHFENIEIHYRKAAYLYLSGYLEESYELLASALEKDYNMHPVLFEIAPQMELDSRVQMILSQKNNRL